MSNNATLLLFPTQVKGYSIEQSGEGLRVWCRIPAVNVKQKSKEGEMPSDFYFRIIACGDCEFNENCARGVDVLASGGCLKHDLKIFQKETDVDVRLFPQLWTQKVSLSDDKIQPLHEYHNFFADREHQTEEEIPLHRYICPNVHPDGAICWGANSSTLRELNPDLRTAYNFFWNSGFNNDLMPADVLQDQAARLPSVRAENTVSRKYVKGKQIIRSDRRVLGLAFFHYNQHEEEFEYLNQFQEPRPEFSVGATQYLDNTGAVHILEISRGIFSRPSGEIVKGYYALYGGTAIELQVEVGKERVCTLGQPVRWVRLSELRTAKVKDVAALG